MSQPSSEMSLSTLLQPPPAVALEDFQILKKLGSGSMGAVYLARQISREREVAVKVLTQSLIEKPSFVERFLREARVMATLNHPGIVRLHGIGRESGCYYYVMEYVNGFTLGSLRDGLGGHMNVGDAVCITLKCADALRHAHAQNVVHRDVKPENVMITHLGGIKITDMGLAKPMDPDLSLTDTGIGVGTPRYAAPEQARDGKHADARSDVYALGGLLYNILTGRLPFEGENSAELLLAKERGVFTSARRFNRDVPPRLDCMIDKMLARDPRNRYQNCDDLIRDLESVTVPHDHLSFNPLHVGRALRPDLPVQDNDHVEVLLIHDQPREIRTIQEALYESRIPSSLRVVHEVPKVLALLRREGKYATVPWPNLILLGLPLVSTESRTILREIRDNETLHTIPVVILSAPNNSSDILAADGLRPTLTVTSAEDLSKVEEVIRSMHSLCLTVVENLGQ